MDYYRNKFKFIKIERLKSDNQHNISRLHAGSQTATLKIKINENMYLQNIIVR